jgi:hypothetical protein
MGGGLVFFLGAQCERGLPDRHFDKLSAGES